jgi:ankyrin repeat protein
MTTPDAQLLAAALEGETVGMRKALVAGASPNARQTMAKAGWTALMCAVLSGKDEAVELLLTAGAEVNTACPDGTTALHKACLWGQVSIAALLLAHGADATLADEDGWTARQLAASQGNPALLQLFSAAGACG